MRTTPILSVATATFLLAATGLATEARAAARSHVEAWARADAPGMSTTQSDGNVSPFWQGAYANRASATARAWGQLGDRQVDVMGRASSQADFSGISASARGDLGPLDDFLMPMGSASGKAMGQLLLDWTITGPAGMVGSITVSGSLFAASYVGNPLQATWAHGSASVMADLSKDCGGPYCGVYSLLNADAGGPTPVVGYQQKDYTLTLPVRVGDRVTLNYLVTAVADGAATSWAGTIPVATLPGAAIAAAAFGAGTAASAAMDGSASFAQQIWLSAGLGLDNPEGLTLLADGHYGFGEVTTVPEPGSGALFFAGLLALVALVRQPARAPRWARRC
jgi:hypothetical protein